jgi:branched-chain amino acid transport system ATP-binding protein
LAPIVVEMIFKVLQEVNRQGVTILLVEQNVKESLDISTRGYVLENGRVSLEGAAGDLLKNSYLKKAYLGL